MPTYRSDLDSIPRYVPGRPIDEVARELGIESLDKLASNECPVEPFPEVIDAIIASASGVNRYPDNSVYDLTRAIADHQGVEQDNVWVGSGSSEILRCSALAVGGPGTSAVFAEPSFVMYRIATMIAGSRIVPVPLTPAFAHDLDAMLAAIDDETTIVYVCNPNNPTGGHIAGSDVMQFIDAVPESVLVIVDEAYSEYVTADDYQTFINEAPNRPNLLVARTFSKIYGLAGLRIGYGVGSHELIASLRRTQAPFTVTAAAQVAALEALRHQDQVASRRDINDRDRRGLVHDLLSLGYSPAPTEANFVYFEPDGDASKLGDDLLHRGEIVRVLGSGVRVTVGTPEENQRLVAALREATTS